VERVASEDPDDAPTLASAEAIRTAAGFYSRSSAFEAWLAPAEIIIGLFLIVDSLEFVGRFEEQGWKPARTVAPITYIAWSLWRILSGLVLLIGYYTGPCCRSRPTPRGIVLRGRA
jgi:hypothetical protein